MFKVMSDYEKIIDGKRDALDKANETHKAGDLDGFNNALIDYIELCYQDIKYIERHYIELGFVNSSHIKVIEHIYNDIGEQSKYIRTEA